MKGWFASSSSPRSNARVNIPKLNPPQGVLRSAAMQDGRPRYRSPLKPKEESPAYGGVAWREISCGGLTSSRYLTGIIKKLALNLFFSHILNLGSGNSSE